ncbi:hypothetical protein BGP84_12895 [Pseudomonas putida]|uniref:Uncharacterized protein n=1 Tax=Pseudomonas putida TaxID=303 RepID=A0A2S3X524_PSEPU|nr:MULTISPECIES: hypothetical protein [Pseudomonas]PTC01454.1 hypothetical protein C9975_02070 [Thalassospira xiamenensis]ELF6204241.1 hypothetical protein [Pseudomonas putida]MBF8803209.1 hypothetical protein [Pseudomonas asiatica]MCE0968684.1 hypothetical protein [Pseudomonas sp. NMI4491_12]MDO1494530.1 hypothetical protein [Pseudomonas putida]
MNINKLLICETCTAEIHCRIGMSNRAIQPLSFLCPECGTAIGLVIGGHQGLELTNASEAEVDHERAIAGEYLFQDLHLDFPIWSEGYVLGNTPFLTAMTMVDRDKLMIHGTHAGAVFRDRLDVLNHYGSRFEEVKQLLKLYPRTNKDLFRRRASEFLDRAQNPSLKQEDLNLLLYSVLSRVTAAFLEEETVEELVQRYPEILMGLAQNDWDAYIAFHNEIRDSGFLHSLQKDCLSLYGKIFELELYIRPAIFLDFCTGKEHLKTSAKISRLGFENCKDTYKDLAEVFARQLSLVAGINNLMHRGGHNAFLAKDGGALSSLAKFTDKNLSEKLKYLDDCWYKIDSSVLNAGVRNAIAHYSFEYDETTQIITCYPKKEGLKREDGVELSFLAFMRMILVLFREMHYLHHLIKSIYYFEHLIISKKQTQT